MSHGSVRHGRAQTPPTRLLALRTAAARGAVAVLAILTASFGLFPLSAAPANAGLNNVMPTDIDGTPNYDFSSDDALFVYATSDIKGGQVCIVAATVENPADASCSSPAWGTPNHIVTIGSYFGPLEAPMLVPGNWKLLAEDSTNQPTMLSETFTVTPCDLCAPEMGTAAVQAWKDAAASSRYGANGYCLAATIKEGYDDGASLDTTDLPGGASFAIGINVSLGGFGFTLPDFSNPGEAKALEILKNLTCQVSAMYTDIVNDPPDYAYGSVASPAVRPLDPTDFESPEHYALAVAMANVEAYGVASRIAYERYQGATLSSDHAARVIQLRAASAMSADLVRSMRAGADQLNAWANFADTQPSLQSPVVASAEEAALWRTAIDRVAASGFSADEVAQLTAAGLNGTQMENVRGSLGRLAGMTPAVETIGTTARSLAAVFMEQAATFDAFSREAAAVASTIEIQSVPPTASFTATPDTGEVPLDVIVDASASTPYGMIASYEWNFGDGSPSSLATGVQALHTYTSPGTYQISLTVRTSNGLAAYNTHSVTVTPPPNRQPIAGADSASVAVGGQVSIPVGANDQDPDGTIASIQVVDQPSVGSVDCYAISHCNYTAPTDAVGTTSFRYRITDNEGATADAYVTITIVGVDQPAAIDDAYTISRGATWQLLLVANDYALNGYPLQISAVGGTPEGDLNCDIGGTECTYTASGTSPTDSFSYTVKDSAGRTSTGTVTIAVSDDNLPPQVRYLVDDISVDEAVAKSTRGLFLASDDDGYIASISWLVDGVPTGANADYLPFFEDDGTFELTIIATDELGAQGSAVMMITVNNATPYFSPNDMGARALPGVPRTFTGSAWDQGPHDLPVIHWNANGIDLEGDSATFTFDEGVHELTAYALDKDGGRSTDTRVAVQVWNTVIDAGEDIVVDEGSPVQFNFAASSPVDHKLSYTVNYGEPGGAPEELSGLVPIHRYANVGNYGATLTQTDALTVGVDPIVKTDTVGVQVVNVDPSILGIANSMAVIDRPTHFVAYPADPGGIEGLTVEWDFGDGFETGTTKASHLFDAPGIYDVSVRVTDLHGGTVTDTRRVAVASSADTASFASTGRDFWVAFGSNADTGPGAYIRVYVAGQPGTTGIAEVPSVGFRATFEIPDEGVIGVDIPFEARLDTVVASASDPLNQPRIKPLAVHVEANADVTMYGINRAPYTTDAFLALPTTVLGDRYRIMDYSPGMFAVAAVAGPTAVTVTPVGDPTREPFTVNLGLGEVMEFERDAGTATGWLVESDQPVAVFGEARCTNVPEGMPFCDHLVEMLTPTSTWGRDFLTVPLATRAADTFRVLADVDDTTVTFTGGIETTVTLQAGEFHEFAVSDPLAISASQPVLLTQYSQGSGADNTVSDPFMAIVPPIEQGFTDSVFATPVEGFTDYVNITAPSASRGLVLLDGAPIDDTLWRGIADSGYSGASVQIAPGVHRITSPVPVSTLVYGFGSDDSYGFPGGMRVARIADIATLTLAPSMVSGAPGTELCTTATVTGQNGPVTGARLDVTITGTLAETFSVTTGDTGSAKICRTSATAGVSSVRVTQGAYAQTAQLSWLSDGNSAPNVSITGDLTVPEGTATLLTALATDADGDALVYAWDLNDDGIFDDGDTREVSVPAPVAGNYPVAVLVSDGTVATPATALVTATNVAPVITLPKTLTVSRTGEVDLAGVFADPGADEWTATVDWGEGAIPLALSGKNFRLASVLAGTGVTPVTVTVSDTAGGSTATAVINFTVPSNRAPVIDPLANISVKAGETVTITPKVSDPDGDPVTLTWRVSAALPAVQLPDFCTAEPTVSGATLIVSCTKPASLSVIVIATDAAPAGYTGQFAPASARTSLRVDFNDKAPDGSVGPPIGSGSTGTPPAAGTSTDELPVTGTAGPGGSGNAVGAAMLALVAGCTLLLAGRTLLRRAHSKI